MSRCKLNAFSQLLAGASYASHQWWLYQWDAQIDTGTEAFSPQSSQLETRASGQGMVRFEMIK